MKFQVIGSGSKGNLTFIESNDTRLLIDAGISIKEIKNRSNIDITNIDGIFITHEHIDHVKYIENIARLSNAVIYVNEKSFNKMVLKYFKDLNDIKVKFIDPNKPFKIKDIKAYNCKRYKKSEFYQFLIFYEDHKTLINTRYKDALEKFLNSIIIQYHKQRRGFYFRSPFFLLLTNYYRYVKIILR